MGPVLSDVELEEPVPTETSLVRASAFDWAVAVAVFLELVIAVPELTPSEWSPETAVGLVIGLAGVPLLVRQAVGGRRRSTTTARRWAARAAIGFVLVALASALTSHPVALAFTGLWQWGGGWVFVLAFAGAYGLGTGLSDTGRNLVATAVIAAATVNAVVAIMQSTVGLDRIGLGLYQGNQAAGLLGNPAYLGGLLVAALGLLADRFIADPRHWWLPVVLAGAGIGMSAERLPALLAAAIVVVVVVLCSRDRRDRARFRHGWLYGALVVAGGVAGTVATELRHHIGTASYAAGSTAQGLVGDRVEIWRLGLQAALRRPWLGYGPGQLRAATLSHYPLSFVRQNPSQYFTDAHDLFVQYAVTTGLTGLVLLAAWLGLAMAHRRGPLLWAGLLMLATELVEPQVMPLMAIGMLCLGAAGVRDRITQHDRASQPGHEPPGVLSRRLLGAVMVGALVGGLVGADVLTGDIVETRASAQWSVGDPGSLGNADLADDLLRPWPEPAELLADIELVGLPVAGRRGFSAAQLLHPHADVKAAIGWVRVAIGRDPTDPSLWAELAGIELNAGQPRASQRDATEAYRLWPWNPGTLRLLSEVEASLGHTGAERHWARLALEVDPKAGWAHHVLTGGCTTGSAVSRLVGQC